MRANADDDRELVADGAVHAGRPRGTLLVARGLMRIEDDYLLDGLLLTSRTVRGTA